MREASSDTLYGELARGDRGRRERPEEEGVEAKKPAIASTAAAAALLIASTPPRRRPPFALFGHSGSTYASDIVVDELFGPRQGFLKVLAPKER